MQFVFPSFLWALLAISIPILIHLFHFRRFRKVYFPSIRFLREIREETSSRNRLKNLLVLLARILAIAALVFAFAQPFIPQGEEIRKGSRAVSLFIDNSFSMNSSAEDISLLEKAKLDAQSIVEAYGTADVFQILTHDAGQAGQNWLNRDEALQRISDIELTHRVRTLSRVMNLQSIAFGESRSQNYLSYWISDFQQSIVDIQPEQLDTTVDYHIIKLNSVAEANLSIDSCWWVAPIPVRGQTGTLIVRLRNYGKEDVEGVALSLDYEGRSFPQGKLDIPGEDYVQDTLRFTLEKGGWNHARLSIRDYPVRFDDDYWIAFEVSETLPVLVISEKQAGLYTRAVFESAPIFRPEFLAVSNIDYGSLDSFRLIVLEDIRQISSGLSSVLMEYMESGGNLLIFPGREADVNSINEALAKFGASQILRKENVEAGVGEINRQEFVFQGVFEEWKDNMILPTAGMRYVNRETARQRNRQVLRFRDGKSYMDAYQTGRGHLYFSTVPLDPEVNDLVRLAEIFVPMIYRMALSSNTQEKISYTIGKDQQIDAYRTVQRGDKPFRILGKTPFIPGMRSAGSRVELDLMDQISEAGIFTLVYEQDTVRELAFNYDRRESDLNAFSLEQIGDRFGERISLYSSVKNPAELKQRIIERDKGIVLWKWFIILALLMLAIEQILLRWIRWK